MRRPSPRADLPPRTSDNVKRQLAQGLAAEDVYAQFGATTYGGSSKHKQNPHLFGLEPFRGIRGDRTLCDKHASFRPSDMARIPALLDRALRASLVGSHIWTVDDNGWIYELAITNPATHERHGYPLRPAEAIAEIVFRHFKVWAANGGSASDKAAALACQKLYGFKP
jgi:hypothetical protein